MGTRETFGVALSRSGFQVDTAGCGAEAVTMAASRPFDLLLVDLQLPDTGTDVIRSVRGASAAPFILISGFLSTEITVDAMKLGAIDVVEKPISVDELPARAVISARFTQIATHPTCRRARRHASQRPPDSKPAARIAATVNRPRGSTLPRRAATKRSTSGASRPAWIEKSPPRPTIAHRLGIADGRSAAAGDRYLPDGRVAACPAQATRLSRASESDKNVGWPPLPTSTGVRQA